MKPQNVKPYPQALKELIGRKSYILSKAHALEEIGIPETVQPFWLSAAAYEEQIAPQLDLLGRELEGAVHRISAASCYQKAGQLSRAVNLYRAALAGPLRDNTRQDVEKMLKDCLIALTHQPEKPITPMPEIGWGSE